MLGIAPHDVGKDELGRYMAQQHPSIEACRVIANGSKHTGLDGASDIVTFVSAGPSFATSPVEFIFTGTPKITMGGLTWGSSDVLRDASDAWTKLIYGRLRIS